MRLRLLRVWMGLLLFPLVTLAADAPLLVVLTETGRERDGFPVLAVHPQGASVAAQLRRGLTGELLGVYRLLQVRQHATKGTAVEPAYLLLSTRQGGFARFGFWLGEEKKSGVPYVDVHRDWEISGRLGAIDQIFPHELAHAIIRQLAGEDPEGGGANQIHAVGVRTDRLVAFNEGFAEHFQVMAVDHPDAAPATRALAQARDLDHAARRHLESYRRELSAPVAPVARMRMGFPLWYSNDERALRYFAVKRNAFAREARIPEHLLTRRDRFAAYLLENTMPGEDGGAVKPVARLIASEGAVSSFFHRWATSGALRQRDRDASFYALFGTTRSALTPLQNLYLKLFHAMETRRALDVPALVRAYRDVFPDEAPLLDAIVHDAFLGQNLDVGPELWLANSELTTGTTLFDQFRGLPRVHTFDLNAASIVDLTSVSGVTPELARAIAREAPYAAIADLARVPGVTPALLSRVQAMAVAMKSVREAGAEELTLRPVFMPYVLRLSLALILAAIAGGLLYRVVRARTGVRPSVLRTTAGGLAAALVAVPVSLLAGSAVAAVAAVVLLFGVPAAAWQLYRTRRFMPAFTAAVTWVVAAIPAAMLTTPWVS